MVFENVIDFDVIMMEIHLLLLLLEPSLSLLCSCHMLTSGSMGRRGIVSNL